MTSPDVTLAPPSSGEGEAPTRRMMLRVLVVDDDPVSRRILERAVEHLGHVCVVASDGLEAWTIYEREHVDVVISDWAMPGLDGIELCRRVRASRHVAYTYFILLTSKSERHHVRTGMEAGADDYLRKPLDPEELEIRMIAATRITALHQRLSAQNQQLERLASALFEQGRTDALTGTGNRLRMQEDLAQLFSRARRSEAHGFSVALCDVDHFKRFNDAAGHQAGDEALRQVARTILATVRAGDGVYRYGGEEFLVVLAEPTLDGAMIAMRRIHAAVRALAIPHPGLPGGSLSISVGVASLRSESALQDLLDAADLALYAAKSRDRDTVVAHAQLTSDEIEALRHATVGPSSA